MKNAMIFVMLFSVLALPLFASANVPQEAVNTQPNVHIASVWSNKDGVFANVVDANGNLANPVSTRVEMTVMWPSCTPGQAPSQGRFTLNYDPDTKYYKADTRGTVAQDTTLEATITLTVNGQATQTVSKQLTIYGLGYMPGMQIQDIWSDKMFVYAKVLEKDGSIALPDKNTVILSLDSTSPFMHFENLGMGYDAASGAWRYETDTLLAQDTQLTATVLARKNMITCGDTEHKLSKDIIVYGKNPSPTPQPTPSPTPTPSPLPVQPAQILYLYKGWNMISSPAGNGKLSLEDIKETCDVRSKLWHYDGSEYQPASVNSVYPYDTGLTEGYGYWLKVANDCKVDMNGRYASNDGEGGGYAMAKGWNQIGLPAMDYKYDPAAGAWAKIKECTFTSGPWQYDAQAKTYAKADMGSLQPGVGYWIKTAGKCDLYFAASGNMPPNPPQENAAPAQLPACGQTTGTVTYHVGDMSSTINGVGIKFDDISMAIGTDNIHPAIVDIVDTSGTVIKQVQINPYSTYTQTIDGIDYRISVYQIRFGFTLASKEADIEFSRCSSNSEVVPAQKPTTSPSPTAQPNQNAGNIDISGQPYRGPANAKVTMVEFADYQCPYCGQVEPTVKQLLKDYGGKIKFVYVNYPLPFHENAEKSAEAAECALDGGEGNFWAMHDKLFANQDALDVSHLKDYASDIGLDTAAFNSCLDSGSKASAVAADMQKASGYGVQGTPTFFINGEMVVGAQPISAFKAVIDRQLAS